jgi:hypothetical protein
VHAAVLAEAVVTPPPLLTIGTALAILTEAAIALTLAVRAARSTLAEVPMTFLSAAVALAETLAAAIHGVPVLVWPQHAREHGEARLLRIIETGIERRTGISDLLKRGTPLGHGIGPVRHPIKRSSILRTLL